MLVVIVEFLTNLLDYFHAGRIYRFYKDKEIDCVIDVGSHKGEFIRKCIRSHSIPIFAVEPQKSVLEILKKNTRSFNVIEYFSCAAADRDGLIDIKLNHLSSTASIFDPDEGSFWIKFKKLILGNKLRAGTQKTSVYRLDTIMSDHVGGFENILLKVDVEGAESLVLDGARHLLSSGRVGFVQIENARFKIFEGRDGDDPFVILKDLGFFEVARFTFPTLNFSDHIFLASNRLDDDKST